MKVYAHYLITDIAGFIASSLARELLQRGEQARGVDSFLTGELEILRKTRGTSSFMKPISSTLMKGSWHAPERTMFCIRRRFRPC